jgi:hypothetical protein
MLTLKTKSLLAYTHTLLINGEELTNEGKGTSIVNDDESKQLMRESGYKIIDYCESIGATREALGRLRMFNKTMYTQAWTYYQTCINKYTSHIAAIGDNHIPILYCVLMLQDLKAKGYIGLELDYDNLLSAIERSDLLKGVEVQSRFSDKMIIERPEIKKYSVCVLDTVEVVMGLKIVKSGNKKKKNSKRRK